MKAQTDKVIISIRGVGKTFAYHKKQEGLKGSVKSLFRKKKLYKEAVRDVSFDVRQGEFIGFIGKNGAGKTTTLKMLSGILTPTSGEIQIDGHEPIKRENTFKKKISIVMGQKSQLWQTLPANETFRLIQSVYDIPEAKYKKRLKKLSELLEVDDILDVQVRKLSLGQRMKCELIGALLHDPKVLFLDEPTIGLDVISQRKIREFLAGYNKREKTTIILTSHYMDDVEDLCDRIMIIDDGQIGYDGSLQAMMDEYSEYKYLHIKFAKPVLKKDLQKFGEVDRISSHEMYIKIKSKTAPAFIRELVSKYDVTDISIKDITLEEIAGDIFEKSSK